MLLIHVAFMNYEPLMTFKHEIMEAAGKFVKMLIERLCHPLNDTVSQMDNMYYVLHYILVG